jgi:hypothetical protein
MRFEIALEREDANHQDGLAPRCFAARRNSQC